MKGTITIVLVDDQTLFVESLKNILEMRTDDLRVVGTALNGKEALEVIDRVKPEVVLMDVRMPELDGVQCAKRVHERHPQAKILMLSTFDDDEYVHEALEHGAIGYLLKTTRPAELIAAIRATRQGIVQISPAVAAKLIRSQHPTAAAGTRPTRAMSEPEWVRYLTHREKEILKLVLEGLTNRQIGERLFIAEQTVKNHLNVVYSKMDAHSRPQVMRKLIDADINLSSY